MSFVCWNFDRKVDQDLVPKQSSSKYIEMKNRIWLCRLAATGFVLVLAGGCSKYEETAEIIADEDGNAYTCITIGTQVWMAENLKTTKYNDGCVIPLVSINSEWGSLSAGAYCWYNNDAANKKLYGALYNWYAVNTGKLCPAGWHVPSDAEWTALTKFLGGESIAGGRLKETGTVHWTSPNTGATNESNFSALPGGTHNHDGMFSRIGTSGFWWSATGTTSVPVGALSRIIDSGSPALIMENCNRNCGFSVRCLKDYCVP